ncbi:MAG: GNAT family N-acetyltransferase, partial [Candidatus Dormibacteraceae bacterium]
SSPPTLGRPWAIERAATKEGAMTTPMPCIWHGKAARLRAVEPEDWRAFSRWDLDTEMARSAYFIPFPRSEEAARKWTAELADREYPSHEFRWVIENVDREAVGTLNTHHCDPRNGTFQYGIAISSEHRRRGYARDAIELVLAYFFRELRYQKANVSVYAFNDASFALHRRLGFREEGRLRRMIYTNGDYHDEIILGITAEEFDQPREATEREVKDD